MEHHLDFFHSVFIPYINFFIFLGALIFLARKPLKDLASGRREKYLSASKEAAQALEKAKEQFAALKAKFDVLESELEVFKQQSESLAKEDSMRMVADGERLATQILDETKKIAAEEISRARRELREEIVAAARQEAEQKISSGLSDADRSRILSSRVSDLAEYRV